VGISPSSIIVRGYQIGPDTEEDLLESSIEPMLRHADDVDIRLADRSGQRQADRLDKISKSA
jgi:hypothetical protein